jgi:MacB-like periplasmic core domain
MIRHALRTIGRMPGLAAVVILSLGVGIGVNTTVFSWIQAVLLKPIPGVDDSGSFYHLETKSDTGTYPGMSWAEYLDLKPRLQAIEELVVFRMAPLNVGEAGRTERTYAQLVSGNLFKALRLQPVAGRFIAEDEAQRPGGEPVVVISHDYWQTRRFAFCDRPDHSRQRLRADDHRRRPERFSRHHPRAAIRSVGAGDAGTRALRRIDRARRSQPARLLGDGPAACRRGRSGRDR